MESLALEPKWLQGDNRHFPDVPAAPLRPVASKWRTNPKHVQGANLTRLLWNANADARWSNFQRCDMYNIYIYICVMYTYIYIYIFVDIYIYILYMSRVVAIPCHLQ